MNNWSLLYNINKLERKAGVKCKSEGRGDMIFGGKL